MYFEQINPFVRYVRYLEFSNKTIHPLQIPYDARLFYLCSGGGKIETENQIYTLYRGSAIIINSNVKYRFITENNAVYMAINFDYTYKHSNRRFPIVPAVANENFNPDFVLENITFSDTSMLNGVYYLKNASNIEAQLLEMHSIAMQKPLYYNRRLSMLMCDILLKCITAKSAESYDVMPEQIIKYLNKNYNLNISNKEIGEIFNFHPNYVNYIVKKYTGLPLHGYILSVRISNAITLLETTDMSIERIGETVGFSSLARFSRQFKKITGVSPSTYRSNSE